MKKELFDAGKRKMYIICGICFIVLVYIVRIFTLQILDNDYKKWADSNAFLNQERHPPRGEMYDRNGKLLVYNQQTYDMMVVMRETKAFDTMAFCRILNIDPDYCRKRFSDVKNRKQNPGYSAYTPQPFLFQLGSKEYGVFRESIYKFPGFYLQNKPVRQYNYPNAAHVLGYIAKADKQDLVDDEYYTRGDYIGKTGLEKQYEPSLRGVKGVEILLRDARGRIKGSYKEGIHDRDPIHGKDLTLSLDIDLQAYGETLMENKLGSIVMIEPATGEILCMVSSPAYDPSILVGRQFGENFGKLAKDPYTPLINRALNGTYPPGSTFKPAQALVFLEEEIIQPSTVYSCYYGWPPGGGRPGCHGHPSPLNLVDAIGHSCNSYFCWGLKALLENKKYGSIENAMDRWRDLMVKQGFGYPLGVDLPNEKRGRIPNSRFYNKIYANWNPFTVISNSIGQGEIEETTLQICNLAATIANRGYYITPHVVKKIRDTTLDSIYTERKYTGIAPEHYETVVAGMRKAVTGGTSRRAYIPDTEVCGKTGTSENKGKDHSVFMAFAPKENPRVAVAVLVENAGSGASTALPIARLMMEKYLNGQIFESSAWEEERIKNTVILRNVVLPKKQYME
ncbi:MAG: penicillin-binding protein 2 [Dysgonamonadaceae bacterium]|nr:penicillin-binding protein 2 [Dysgonamonadaceae bacterium]